MTRRINVDAVLRALWLAILATAPSAVLFTVITWRLEAGARYLIVGIHCVLYVGAFIFFLQPRDRQWRILRSIARDTEQDDALKKLEQQAKEEEERERRWK